MQRILLIISYLILVSLFGYSEVRVPKLIADGMILQRNTDLKIWGWADPTEQIMVKFNGEKYRTVTDKNGEWQVIIEPMKAGGPYSMEIAGKNKIDIKDILIGDIWVCSGQSNMTHNFGRHQERYAKEIAEANYPKIRQIFVPTTAVLEGPVTDNENLKWEVATPETVLNFTLVGYFFVLKLYEKYNVPMGIINTCVGGTKIEAWTSEEGFKEFPEISKTIVQNKDTAYVNEINRIVKAERNSKSTKSKDKGLLANIKWFDPEYKPLNWKSINIPGFWEDQGISKLDGVVWYRREIEVPEAMTQKEALVKLGRIVDADELYINGQSIGNTGYQYPQRKYKVPAGILKPGNNLFVVRVTNQSGKGGFIPDKPYYLLANNDTIDLKGTWEYKVGEVFTPQHFNAKSIRAQGQPTALYNGMIAPFTNFAVSGALWYQGESNASDPEFYGKLLPNLIEDWRTQWNNPELPFFIAQLPNFMDVDYLPTESNWAEMRDVQLQTTLSTTNCGIGINIDLGEWNDIHPGNKKPVGERLALQAMEIVYNETDLVSSGPIYKSQRIEDNKIILTFDHIGSGLVSGNAEELNHFSISGEDKNFIWAKASIQNNEVVVWCDEILNPKFVRYAWANNPDFANLYNREGLPASPFKTDK